MKGDAYKALWNEYCFVTKAPSKNGFFRRLIGTCWRQKMLIQELTSKK